MARRDVRGSSVPSIPSIVPRVFAETQELILATISSPRESSAITSASYSSLILAKYSERGFHLGLYQIEWAASSCKPGPVIRRADFRAPIADRNSSGSRPATSRTFSISSLVWPAAPSCNRHKQSSTLAGEKRMFLVSGPSCRKSLKANLVLQEGLVSGRPSVKSFCTANGQRIGNLSWDPRSGASHFQSVLGHSD